MKRITTPLACLFTALLCGGLAYAALHTSDLDGLQGKWKGTEVGREDQGQSSLLISGNILEVRGADTNEWYKGTITLREDKNPRQLDLLVTGCPSPDYIGKTAHAIYRFESQNLRISGNEPGKPQVPSTFDAEGARQFLFKKN
jgi:uncharacterized protein (TIGR03067 family)